MLLLNIKGELGCVSMGSMWWILRDSLHVAPCLVDFHYGGSQGKKLDRCIGHLG
jgi:hypothetical protein